MTKTRSIAATVATMALLCLGGCSSNKPLPARSGGSGGLGAGGAGTGGVVGQGGAVSSVGGNTVAAGGRGTGGASAGGSTGTVRKGGATGVGGTLSSAGGTSGKAATGGTVGTGGVTGAGGTGGRDGGGAVDASSAGGDSGGVAAADGGNAGGEAGGCAGCQPLEQCHGRLCVAKLVAVPAGFSIDATEVTRGQYAAWLATNPSTAAETGLCAWNTSFAPDATCMAGASVCQGAGCSQHPQPCIDMCDAKAYCAAVGKRLCGAIGGGSVAADSYATKIDATKSQWQNACSSGGANDGPGGGALGKSNCNDDMANINTTVLVGSMPSCQSSVAGYAGIFDIIGNLWEWEDNCQASAGASDLCFPRGISFRMGAAAPVCDYYVYQNRNEPDPETGFRCCAP
jgi:hypothetical protein